MVRWRRPPRCGQVTPVRAVISFIDGGCRCAGSDHQAATFTDAMADPAREPPRQIWYELEEALGLLADLEDARDALTTAGQLSTVVLVEHQIRLLSRKLEFDDWPGTDDR